MTIRRRWLEAREAWELGRMIQCAINRGRKLHPWVSREESLKALRDEVYELHVEIHASKDTEQKRTRRIQAEALDCAVVALRIMLDS